MIIWLLAIGLVSLLGQVILLRELNVAFFGSELIYILCLGVWLLWTGTGAALGRRRSVPSPAGVRRLLLVTSLVLPLEVVLCRGLRLLCGGVPGAYLPFPVQMLAMLLALLPLCLLLGLLFQWAAKLYLEGNRTLASAYAIESAGALVGGVLATLFLKWGLQNFSAAILCALGCLVLAWLPHRQAASRSVLTTVAILGVALLAALCFSGRIDARMTAWNHPQLAATRDSPYGRVTVTEAGGQISVFENDALSFESQGTEAEEFAHVAALHHPHPRSVLVLGGGTEGLAREILEHRPESVDVVELNGVLIEMVSSRLEEDVRDSLNDPAVRLVIDDPRRFLGEARAYDLILVGMPEPESGQANRFYTREFFAQCRERLAPSGILAFRLKGAVNLWTPQLIRRTASIHRALMAVFSHVTVLPASTNIFLASDVPVINDPDILGARLEERGIEARLVIPAYLDYLYTSDRFAEIEGLLAGARAPVNSDTRPICYQYTLLLWLSRFFPVLVLLDLPELTATGAVASPYPWVLAALILGVFLLTRRVHLVRGALLATVAGFAGMVLETVLILHYQMQRGILFQDLGVLLTLFMAGLALGAAVVARLVRRGAESPASPGSASRLIGAAAMVALAALGLAMALLIRTGLVGGLLTTGILMLVSGFLVAALFAYASLRRQPDQRSIVSPLYSADLLGGCAGSLLASLLLIPMLGLPASAALMAALALLALALI